MMHFNHIGRTSIPFFRNAGQLGYARVWEKSFDEPLTDDEIADAIRFRNRCGHVDDVTFFDAVEKLRPGKPYECPHCAATWLVEVA